MAEPGSDRLSRAALAALVVLQSVMLAALYAGVAPHPPRVIPLFALGPFLAASIALAVFAWSLLAAPSLAGRVAAVAAALLALVSFGPQKLVDPAFGEIWPAVIVAAAAACLVIVRAIFIRGRAPQERAS